LRRKKINEAYFRIQRAPRLFFIAHIAFFLTEYASAVLLHIKAFASRGSLPFAKHRAKVAVYKFNAAAFRGFFRGSRDHFMSLIRADKQCGGELAVPVIRGVFGSLNQTRPITITAPALYVIRDIFYERAQAVNAMLR